MDSKVSFKYLNESKLTRSILAKDNIVIDNIVANKCKQIIIFQSGPFDAVASTTFEANI